MSANFADYASPEQLAQWPELAALELAEHAAATAVRALIASCPVLEHRDFLIEHDAVTPQLCLAAAALSALDLAAIAIERYRLHLDQLAAAGVRATTANDDF